MHTVTVDLKDRSYPIYIGVHVLEQFGDHFVKHLKSAKAFIITNEKVGGLYLKPVLGSLKEAGITAHTITIGDGEEYKTQETVNYIYDQLVNNKCERGSAIVALGGGVVGDIAGYVAATFLRGINYVQIPTTLLAQTDSSVGGKVGINHPAGKNMIGAFYQPRFVFINIDVLETLEKREFIAGLAEVLKYGMLGDAELFAYLEDHIDELMKVDINTLVHIVKTCCEIKAEIVTQDETEQGVRAVLNYGHTYAHAIETVTDYAEYKHGEAVMMGMIIAGKTAVTLGMLSKEAFDRQNKLIIKFFLPRVSKKITAKKMLAAMRSDKKVKDEKLRLVLAKDVGMVEIVTGVDDQVLIDSITWFLETSKHKEK